MNDVENSGINMNTLDNIIDHIDDIVNDFIKNKMEKVSYKDIHLDYRSSSVIFINDECIAIPIDFRRTLDYYGGFEYVDDESVKVIGNYVFYMNTDDRVQDHIDHWKNKNHDDDNVCEGMTND